MNKCISTEAIAWIVTGIAVIAGFCITNSANCLWAFVIPMISFH